MADGNSGPNSAQLCLTIHEMLMNLPENVSGKLEKPLLDPMPTPGEFENLGVGAKIRFASSICAALKRSGFITEMNYSQLLYPNEKDAVDIVAFLGSFKSQEAEGNSLVGPMIIRSTEEDDATSGGLHESSHEIGNPPPGAGWKAVEGALKEWMRAGPKAKGRSTIGASSMMRKERQQSAVAMGEALQVVDSAVETKWRQLELEFRENASRLGRIASVTKSRQEENERLTQKVKALEKAQQLYNADAAGNAKKLEEIVQVSRGRLLDLVKEWEEHRVPMVDELKHKSAQRSKLRKQYEKAINELEEMRRELLQLQDRLTESAAYSDPATTKKSTPATVYVPGKGSEMRANVVLRVLDSVRQLKKQTAEIEKVVHEVKQVQSEFSLMTERLNAVENELDDMLFTSAKQHPVGVETYEFFVDLVEAFDELLQLEKAAHVAEIDHRDRVARCHSIAARVSALRIDSVASDLEKIKAENKLLKDKLLMTKQARKRDEVMG